MCQATPRKYLLCRICSDFLVSSLLTVESEGEHEEPRFYLAAGVVTKHRWLPCVLSSSAGLVRQGCCFITGLLSFHCLLITWYRFTLSFQEPSVECTKAFLGIVAMEGADLVMENL